MMQKKFIKIELYMAMPNLDQNLYSIFIPIEFNIFNTLALPQLFS